MIFFTCVTANNCSISKEIERLENKIDSLNYKLKKFCWDKSYTLLYLRLTN